MSDVRTFLAALADLMEEHGIDWIGAADEWTGYRECGEDLQIRIEHKTDYNFDPGLGSLVSPANIRELLDKEPET